MKYRLSIVFPLLRSSPLLDTMPNCKKVPGTTPGRILAMSVIEEEPAHMRESRLGELEKLPDQESKKFSPSPRVGTGPDSSVYRSETAVRSSGIALSSPSTEASSSEDVYPTPKNLRAVKGPRRTSRLDFSQNSAAEPQSRHHSSPTRHERSPRHRKLPIHEKQSDPEYVPRINSITTSSSEEEDVSKNQPQRLPRRHAGPHSRNRTKSSSIPSRESSVPQTRVRRQTPSPPLSSPDEAPRMKKPTRLDSIHSPSPEDAYEYHPREAARQAPRLQPNLRVKTRSKSSTMLPPFREPYAERELAHVEVSRMSSAHQAEEHMHRRMPRQVSPRISCKDHRSKSSPSLSTSPFISDIDMSEDRQTRVYEHSSPSLVHRSTAISKPRMQTHISSERRQAASCRGVKVPLSPTETGPSDLKDQHHGTLLPNRDSRRTRSTSLRQKKSLQSDFIEDSILRSASASSLSSQGSMPSPHTSVPQIPLRLRHYEGRFSNRRKQTLFYFSLFPAEKMPMRGVVVSLHGIGDHCRRNVKLYERLCREGFGVITYDLLNHGVSDLDQHKIRAHISNFSHLVDDTNDFITFAKRFIYKDALRYWRMQFGDHGQEDEFGVYSQPELPLIIAGTSFGSLVGIHTVLAGEHKFDGAVWGSPTLGITWNPLLWAESKLAKPLAAILPTAKVVPAVPLERLCRDPKFLRRFKADPLTSMDMMTSRTGHESLQAMIQLEDDKRVTNPSSAFCAVPTLFLAGSADSISDHQAAIKFFGMMGNFDKEFKLFDGLFHLVYEEPEKEDVFRYLARWLHRRFPVESCQ
ncbi:putative serine aminopeptidase, S33, alpha/Beta hydrolase [Plasmopara halstedii]